MTYLYYYQYFKYLFDFLRDHHDYIYKNSFGIDLNNVFEELSNNEIKIVNDYYGIGNEYPKTLKDIGDDIGLTRERIRQIKSKVIKKLRFKMNIFRKYMYMSNNYNNFYYNLNKNKINYNENGKEILKKWLEPIKKEKIYPSIKNLSKECRKLIRNYIRKAGRPCTENELRKYIYSKYPKIKKTSVVTYALSSSEYIVELYNGIYGYPDMKNENNSNNKTNQKSLLIEWFDNE